eukprot:4746005-Alexandrium_andersonii.AAC.1
MKLRGGAWAVWGRRVSGHWRDAAGRSTRAHAAGPLHVQFRPAACAAGKCFTCRAPCLGGSQRGT